MTSGIDGESEPLGDKPTDEDLSARAESAYRKYCRDNQLTPVPVSVKVISGDEGKEVVLLDANENVVTRFQVKEGRLHRIAPVALPD